MRSRIAAWRLVLCALHALHGLAIVLWRFGALDAAGRHARIQWWSRKMLRTIGIELRVEGEPARGGARGVLLVANHISWLDVMAVHAVVPQARFVSKAAVKSWPVLSRLVDAAGTLYLERERKRDALRVVHAVAEALIDGQTVAVFPEGTTSDGRGLLPFHANMLQAAIAAEAQVQPIALRYADADGPVSRAVEFVGATTLTQSLWRTARGERVTVRVALLPPQPAAHADRRALAQLLRDDIAAALGIDPGERAAVPATQAPTPELAQG